MGLFENFPYTNFHDMNADWLVSVAKDFLDKYSHIDETLEEGIDGLNELAETLEGQLNQWYTTHSEDIAQELATSLTAISNAVTAGENDLDDHMQDLVDTLPSDFTDLIDEVEYGVHVAYPQHIKGVTGVMSHLKKVIHGKRYDSPQTGIIDDIFCNILCFETGLGFITGDANNGHGYAYMVKADNTLTDWGTGVVALNAIPATVYAIVNEDELDYVDLDFITDGMPIYAKRTYNNIPVTEFGTLNSYGTITEYGGSEKAFAPFRMTGTLDVTGASVVGVYNPETGVYKRSVTTFPTLLNDEIAIVFSSTPENVVITVNGGGSPALEGAVLYNQSQSLTDLQKNTAKTNIGANYDSAISELQTTAVGLSEDVDDLQDETSDLKNALVNVVSYANDGIYTFLSEDIEQGGIGTNGNNLSGNNRLRTRSFIPICPGMKISFNSGTTINQIAIREYDVSQTITSYSSWSANGYTKTFDHYGYLRYMVRKSNDATITVSDYDATVKVLTVDNDKITTLEADIKDIKLTTSPLNTFTGVVRVAWQQGGLYAATGLPYTTNNAIRTDFISVDGVTKLVFCNPNSKSWKIYPYDTNKDFISAETKAVTTDKTGEYNIGSSTKYIRVQLSETDIVIDDAEGFMIADANGYIFDYIAERQEVSILFVGNSLTQDGIAYLPYLLKTYYPEIRFRFYMWYNGGKTLKQQYEDYFYTDTACSIFSVAENTSEWTNYDSTVKMSAICTTYKFDIVCLQEYFNYKTEYTEANGINDWNNCRDYITSHYTGGNGLEFISLFHAPLRNNAPTIPSGETTDTIFQKILAGNNLILQKTIADDMIPNGIAIYRALSTSLDSLGDMTHLSPDGTHAQEGLPCLLQTFVTACWLFDRLGIARSVYGCPLRMTTAIYNTLNIPGANLGTGVITGTDAQNLLAQEVAIKAYKEGKYDVNNNIFNPN